MFSQFYNQTRHNHLNGNLSIKNYLQIIDVIQFSA